MAFERLERAVTHPAFKPNPRWTALFLPAAPWFPGEAAAIFLKYKLIGPALGNAGGGNGGAASTMGAGFDLTAWPQYLSYFRGDLLVCLIAIPVLLMLLARALPAALRAWPAAVLGSTAVAAIYIQRQALNNVGIFLGWPPPLDAAAWEGLHPGEILTYLKPGGLLRAAGLVASIWLLAVAVHRQIRGAGGKFLASMGFQRVVLGAAAFAAAISAAAWLPRARATWLHEPALVRAIAPLAGLDGTPAFVTVERDPLALERRYRELTGPRPRCP